MKKVAVFGNTGGGKSTLARRVAELTQLPLYPLDAIQFNAGGITEGARGSAQAEAMDAASTKQVHHLKSPADMRAFLEVIEQRHRS